MNIQSVQNKTDQQKRNWKTYLDISVNDERIPKTNPTVKTINQNNTENEEDFRRDEKSNRNQARLDCS
jgi:hypothetical protein